MLCMHIKLDPHAVPFEIGETINPELVFQNVSQLEFVALITRASTVFKLVDSTS